jgi:pentatricopeptide repeat protein
LAAAKNENLPPPPISQSYLDYLFAECVAHDEWDLAIIDVIDLMKDVRLKVQYSTYNACLQACFQAGNAGSAMQILLTMESLSNSNIRPQINDYTLVLLAMCRNDQSESGWCQKAVQLLDSVKIKTQQDVPITVYDAILTCLIKERQWKMSVKILQNMEDNIKKSINATQPALSTYRTVIECCVAANQGDAAFRVLKSYIQKNGRRPQHGSTMPMPTSYIFEMVIAAQSKSTQQWRQAVQLLDNMFELGVPRTLLIYNSLLIACSKAREPIAAKSLLQRMKRYDHPQIKPNIISYNTAIAACCMNHQHWRDALTIFDQMQREPGVTPDICTYTKYVSNFCMIYKLVESYLQKLRLNCYSPPFF